MSFSFSWVFWPQRNEKSTWTRSKFGSKLRPPFHLLFHSSIFGIVVGYLHAEKKIVLSFYETRIHTDDTGFFLALQTFTECYTLHTWKPFYINKLEFRCLHHVLSFLHKICIMPISPWCPTYTISAWRQNCQRLFSAKNNLCMGWLQVEVEGIVFFCFQQMKRSTLEDCSWYRRWFRRGSLQLHSGDHHYSQKHLIDIWSKRVFLFSFFTSRQKCCKFGDFSFKCVLLSHIRTGLPVCCLNILANFPIVRWWTPSSRPHSAGGRRFRVLGWLAGEEQRRQQRHGAGQRRQ